MAEIFSANRYQTLLHQQSALTSIISLTYRQPQNAFVGVLANRCEQKLHVVSLFGIRIIRSSVATSIGYFFRITFCVLVELRVLSFSTVSDGERSIIILPDILRIDEGS